MTSVTDPASPDPSIAHLVDAQRRDVDGFFVGRALPSRQVRMVGPWVFFDHFGPVTVPAGRGMDVRPHPHIGLSTVTYLLAGHVFHRDSLGNAQAITPGAINWMSAGHGIVHSERSPPEERARERQMHGLQLWVASPREREHDAPAFSHHPADTLPTLALGPGVAARVLAGEAYGVTAPVPVQSPLCYVEVSIAAGATLEPPHGSSAAEERALYLLSGEVEVGAARLRPGALAVLAPGAEPVVRATMPTQLVMIGGEPIGKRYVWWNFVASDKAELAEAAKRWRAGEFPKVPGDEVEFIPLETDPPRFAD